MPDECTGFDVNNTPECHHKEKWPNIIVSGESEKERPEGTVDDSKDR